MRNIQNTLWVLLLSALACQSPNEPSAGPEPMPPLADYWNNATIYFLLTDRFHNADPANDNSLGRRPDGAPFRYFMGGDIKGVTEKIETGYFTDLGVNALWLTPFFEQIKGSVDEGTGMSYGYHGYWTRDWTAVDPNYGTREDLARMVEAAHEKGIRVVMDVIVNHTGPVTEKDPQWPDSWVITGPRCTYQGYETTVECTLVNNLPDVRTDKDEPVPLPDFLVEKWEEEGRLEEELEELDAFFERTGYPRAPRYYLIKWLTDWIRDLGIDAYRMDTAKHFEEEVGTEIKKEAVWAYQDWKSRNPDRKLPDLDFFMFGEVYGYGIEGGRYYDFGDKKVDYFAHGYNSLINFSMKEDARLPMHQQFQKYADSLAEGGSLAGVGVVNYLTSHDDSGSFDRTRRKPMEAATRLLLNPGAAQIYYGDETARLLVAEAEGDAQLRTPMNWEALEENDTISAYRVQAVLEHWQKLGQFRRAHISVGSGAHQMHQESPYWFSRVYEKGEIRDRVLIGLDLSEGRKEVSVFELFAEGEMLRDHYSGQRVRVNQGRIVLDSPHPIVLLERLEEPED
jgi:alpha-amylase